MNQLSLLISNLFLVAALLSSSPVDAKKSNRHNQPKNPLPPKLLEITPTTHKKTTSTTHKKIPRVAARMVKILDIPKIPKTLSPLDHSARTLLNIVIRKKSNTVIAT